MTLYSTKNFSLFIGNKETAFNPEIIKKETPQTILDHPPFSFLKEELKINTLVFGHQVHGTQGITITKKSSSISNPLLSCDSDFFITREKNVGIGVLTADCLPIIFVDTEKHAIGIAHAGWRGTVNGIALSVLEAMQTTYKSNVKDLLIFFGPCAKICCYEVDETFKENLHANTLAQTFFTKRNDLLFFDIAGYNKALLIKTGVPEQSFSYEHHFCTLCTTLFCSHRKSGGDKRRQMTVISLK